MDHNVNIILKNLLSLNNTIWVSISNPKILIFLQRNFNKLLKV